MEITVRDEKTGREFDLDVDPDNTISEVVNALVEGGYIVSSPGEGYYWALEHQGTTLQPGQTLRSAGVTSGSLLRLIPVPIPG